MLLTFVEFKCKEISNFEEILQQIVNIDFTYVVQKCVCKVNIGECLIAENILYKHITISHEENHNF